MTDSSFSSNNDTPSFPLLQLPQNVIIQTIRTMDIDELLGLSLTSKRCKHHVASLKINTKLLKVEIGTFVTIKIETSTSTMEIDFSTDYNGEKKQLTSPQLDKIYLLASEERQTDWEFTSDFEFQDWLEHLFSVFNYTGIKYLQFRDGSFEYDLNEIKHVFGSADELIHENSGCHSFNKMIFQTFLSHATVVINTDSFQDPSSILIRHFDILGIREEEGVPITLNDLLMTNSKMIEMEVHRFSPKLMNKFIKLWMNGANTHLEYLAIYCATRDDNLEEGAMKGIKYMRILINQERMFKTQEEVMVRGGMDIQRRVDGTRATIEVSDEDGEQAFSMFVWHDHCA